LRLARPAQFNQVDAFLSHSWSDDASAKWLAICDWRRNFRAVHGREPVVWFDKCCLDQTQIADHLACLPVFLAGCNRLVLFMGATYLRRLWCIIEIFIFLEMGGSINNIELVLLHTDADSDEEEAGVRELERHIAEFAARDAGCLLQSDANLLLATIEQGFGGFPAFDAALRAVLGKLVQVRAATELSRRNLARLQGSRSERSPGYPSRLFGSAVTPQVTVSRPSPLL